MEQRLLAYRTLICLIPKQILRGHVLLIHFSTSFGDMRATNTVHTQMVLSLCERVFLKSLKHIFPKQLKHQNGNNRIQ